MDPTHALPCRAEGEDAFLGAAFFLVPARAAESGIKPVQVEGLLERIRLHDLSVQRRARDNRVDVPLDTLPVDVHDQSIPSRLTVSSRNAIISWNFQVVSTCRRGNGNFDG